MSLTRRLYDWFGPPQPGRGDWAESEILRNEDRMAVSFPLQPLNTWSNLAYAAWGSTVLWVNPGPEAFILSVTMWLLAIGSALYHGWPTLTTNLVDRAGMNASFLALLGIGLDMHWGAILMLVSVGAYAMHEVRFDVNLAMVLLFGTLLAVLSLGEGALPEAGARGMASFLVSFWLWLVDRNRQRLSGRVGHALWHVGTAQAMGLFGLAVLGA